jgi:hypothetical protein
VNRCRGHRGVFVTLTYRREDWDDSQDCYRSAQEQQHVPLFLRKVSRFLGESLKSRWICKLEFQEGGWVHWHIIILDVNKIPHAELTRMWGRGHVWINRLSPGRIRYCCKYVCKGGQVPGWLYAEPTRGVKVVRVSPGFWGDVEPKEPSEQDPFDFYGWKPPKLPFWKSIGQRIEESQGELVATDGERYSRPQADFGPLLVALVMAGHMIVGNDRGWVVVDCEMKDLDEAVRQAAVCGSACRSASAAAPPPLHLTEPRNPDVSGLPRWMKGMLFDMFGSQCKGVAA